jgi:hypothetical protein
MQPFMISMTSTTLAATARRSVLRACSGLILLGAVHTVPAQTLPSEFQGADLALGQRLLRENQCAECHIRRVGGDGNAIYRPQGRISRPSALLAMVELCSVELKLGLFPEEVQAIAAVLNRDHYRFK